MLTPYIDQLDIRGMLKFYSKEDIDKTRGISLGTLKRVLSTFPKTSSKKHKGNAMIYTKVPIVAHFSQFTDKPGYVEIDFVDPELISGLNTMEGCLPVYLQLLEHIQISTQGG